MSNDEGPSELRVRGDDESPPEAPGLGARASGWLRDLVILVVGAVVVWVGLGWLRAPSLPSDAPALRGVALDGSTVDLDALRGQTVVLNFWATWCPPCRAEMPMLVDFAADTPDVPVLFVAMDEREAVVRGYVSDNGVPASRVIHADRAVRDAWGVSTLPTTVVVGPDGGIRSAHSGLLIRPHLWWMTR
jgi:thiol-disulfide isomerase/thioredoxin